MRSVIARLLEDWKGSGWYKQPIQPTAILNQRTSVSGNTTGYGNLS